MKCSLFLQLPLVASALLGKAQTSNADRAKKGFLVASGEDRYQEELLIMGGSFDCKVSGKDTDGDLCIYDTVRQEKGGPAHHLHHNQDEWFYNPLAPSRIILFKSANLVGVLRIRRRGQKI